MVPNFSRLPEQVRNFITACVANAKTVGTWSVCDMEGGKCFADTLLCISQNDDGSVEISDNYEQFFSTIYTYTAQGEWKVRRMYSEEAYRPYSYEKAMRDASVLYTG